MYNIIFSVDVDKSNSHIDFMFSEILYVEPWVQHGLQDSIGEVLVSVIGRGCFAFDLNKEQHPNYIAEKLRLGELEGEVIKNYLERLKQNKI